MMCISENYNGGFVAPIIQRLTLGATLLLCLIASPAFGQRGLKNIPDPDPKKQQATFTVAEGFEVNLYASDPMIAKPIQINFDASGRLWVASSEIYPHIKPGQKANDKIIVLEDTDKDGKADVRHVFADGLLIPTAVIPGDSIDDGQMSAYVANSTELLHLIDMDFDDKADKKTVILSGFGTEDTHHILHTLRWGVDGRLYFNQSIYIHSHIETPYGVKRLDGGGIWRFNPQSMKLDVYAHGFINSWGHHFDRWGQQFATDGAYGTGINFIIRGGGYQWTQSFKPWMQGLNPGQPKQCGLAVISGRHLPEKWRGVLVTNDFRGNRINAFKLTEDGAGFKSQQMENLITSSSVAFRPIDVKMGPDGAIYIADWYNPIIQHGEVDFRDKRRDHVHGRIWRITYKGRPLVKMPKLVDAEVPDIVEALKDPEDFTRLHAKRQLKWHERDEVLPAVEDWLKELDPKEAGYEHHRLEALWTYQTIDEVKPKLLEAVLKSPDHRARAAATRIVGSWAKDLSDPVGLLTSSVNDDHPRVRLEAVRALALLQSRQAAEIAMQALDRPVDKFLDYALMLTARDLKPYWLEELKAGKVVFNGNASHLAFALKAAGGGDVVKPLVGLLGDNKIAPAQRGEVLQLVTQLGGPRELAVVLKLALADTPGTGTTVTLNALAAAAAQRGVKPQGDLKPILKLLDSKDASLAAATSRLVGLWKLEAGRSKLAAVAQAKESTQTARQAAIDGLARLAGPPSRTLFEKLAAKGNPLETRMMSAVALASLDIKVGSQYAAAVLADVPAGIDTSGVFRPLVRHKRGPDELAVALKGKKLQPDVAKTGLQVMRLASRQAPKLNQALYEAGGLANVDRKFTPEKLKQMVADVAAKGDPARGQAVYRRAQLGCMNCHAIGGAGGRVGPDLSSIGSSAQIDYLVEALFDPNKAIKEGFHAVAIVTKDEQVFAGIPVRKTKQQIVLRTTDDREVTIDAKSIQKQNPIMSLMPVGLIDPLTSQEVLDLTAFLSQLGKQGTYAIGRARVARKWGVLFWTGELGTKLRQTSVALAATNDPVLNWSPRYSNVQGELPLSDIPSVRRFRKDPYMFVRCEIEVTTPGKVRLGLNSTDGLSAWIDGKTVTPGKEFEADLSRGRHSVTFVIDPTKRKAGVRLELLDAKDSKASARFVSGK